MQNRKGTIREERLSQNLLNGKFKIDERQFWDILGYLTSFLQQINYYNTENELDGKWNELIENDPVIYIVSIINDPLGGIEELLQERDFSILSPTSKIKIVKMLLDCFDRIKKWYDVLHEMGEYRLANKVGNILNDLLIYEKRQLEKFISQKNIRPDLKSKLGDFMPAYAPPPTEEASELNINKAINIFFKGIYHIKETAQKHLLHTIKESKGHKAHTSLYIVFTLLYQKLSDKINLHGKNHLDFYYKNVLQQQLNQGEDSFAIVSFDLLPKIPHFLLEAGTKVSAGKINGSLEELTFETQKQILIQDIKLEELQTLYFNKNPYIKVGTSKPIISSINHNHLIKNGEQLTDNKELWYLFGASEESSLQTQINAKTVASMGFVISSPVLILSEGNRVINLNIKFKEQSPETSLSRLLNEMKAHRQLELTLLFAEIFDNAFKISYSSEKEWISFDHYQIDFNEVENEIRLKLVVGVTKPPIALPKNNDKGLSWPAISVELNEYAPIYAYSFLKGIELDTIKINVEVTDVKNLSIYNNIGKIGLGKPFNLFGPIPSVRSWIMLGKSELFQKNVTSLTIKIDWDSLPADFGGFESYYDGYTEEISNDSFKVQFSMLSNGYWIPNNPLDQEEIPLFETYPCVTTDNYDSVLLKNSSTLCFTEIDTFGLEQVSDLKDPLLYTVNSTSGFVRLMLTAPSYAFGQDLYQQEFTAVATYNAQNKTNLPYPNKPYVPKVNKISLNYNATDTLFFDTFNEGVATNGKKENKFLHISPFGWNTSNIENTNKSTGLLPNYEGEGYLLIHLKGIKNAGLITLYFDLQTVGNQSHLKENVLSFQYKEFGMWKPLSLRNIMLDDTNGLTKSGIMELLLPEVISDVDSESTIYQLRIKVLENAASYPRLKGIYLNATVVKSNVSDPKLKGYKLNPGSITKLVQKSPKIQKVFQPSFTFGGKRPESEVEFYTRVSERLKHKDRAVSCWDYERLLLERFTDLKAVKCTNLNPEFVPMPGQVKIIVMPKDWNPENRSFFNQNRLNEMKDYINKLVSASVVLDVINPQVEYLMARGVIEFKPEEQGGYYDQKINEDVNTFLSPVYNMKNSYEGIGGVVVPNTVVGFIEDLPYIKSVKKFAIEHIIQNGANSFSLGIFNEGQEIEPSTPWSVLVPFTLHHLENSNRINEDVDITNPGIGALEIGADFILGEPYHELASVEIDQDKNKALEEKTTPENAILVCKTKK
ncbi:hypothetical protein [Ascidiimonas sp. W6]|uniref:hypothetical protein n=1 Tax=Ascidiimonas meishanensis TaxID=3128903 RepID=UPI0030EC26B6